MDIDKLYKLLTVTVMLNDHPRLVSMRKLVNHEIDMLAIDADYEAADLDEKIKKDKAVKESEANARARIHQEGQSVPSSTARAIPSSEVPTQPKAHRDNYEGVPGPAEAAPPMGAETRTTTYPTPTDIPPITRRPS